MDTTSITSPLGAKATLTAGGSAPSGKAYSTTSWGVLSAYLSIAANGTWVREVTTLDGKLTQYDTLGAHYISNGVISGDMTFAPNNAWVLDIVTTDHALTRIDSAGHRQQLVAPGGARSAAVAFDAAGHEVYDVIYADLSLWQYDSTGAHKVLQL
jgi:hypothetical protein